MKKNSFAMGPDQFRPLAEGYGRCLATDRITVDGQLVGYFYREQPRDADDSGWSFFAGDETEEYTSVADNIGIFDVNTVANYDPRIIPLLNHPPGSAFYSDRSSGKFIVDAERQGGHD